MNDYAHLRLHEATIRGTTRNAGHRLAAGQFLATRRTRHRRRDTSSRTSAAAARRVSQVRPA